VGLCGREYEGPWLMRKSERLDLAALLPAGIECADRRWRGARSFAYRCPGSDTFSPGDPG